ncbi:MAG: ABC transporter ATP-binding protein [Flavipsychrobacter sp.]|nr:ABC transporter ATP-binding protein [Flavipsychrobacter sp.]
MALAKLTTLRKFLEILKYEKDEIYSIYFYSVLSGLVQLSLPLGIQSIISFVLGGAISTSLVLLIIMVIVGVFVAGLLQVNQMKLIEKIQQQLFVRYSFQYAYSIPNFNLKEVDKYYLPELVNRFFDTISLQKSISKLLLDIPAATIQIIFGLILLSFYHPVFILFGLSLLTVLYLILRISGNRGLQTSLEESDYKYKVLGYLEELARVITSFKFSRNSSLHLDKTDEYVTGYLNARTSHFKILLFQYWTLIAFKVLITTAMLLVGAFLLIDQQINIGQFIAAEIVILMVINSVEKLIINLDQVYDVMTSVEKITKVTEKPLENNGRRALDTRNGIAIEAQNLTFGYDGQQNILKDVSLSIPAGTKVCIQGKFGSGKSTLLKLLSGAYPDYEGSLFINNAPLSEYELNTLRKNTGIMLHFQELFEGTVEENITMGEQDIPFEQLDELAGVVGLKEFILANKSGYKLKLQPMGQHLPARIIKKILLMRALINEPNLVLLEEPWLGLEEQYVERIKHYLLNRLSNSTLLVVTSDEDFSRQCDQVITLDNGQIINN